MNAQETINHYLNNDLLLRMLDTSMYPKSLQQWRNREFMMLASIFDRYGSNARVVDFGCGDGQHLRALRRRFGYGLGIDIDPAAIEMAQAFETKDQTKAFAPLEYRVASMDSPGIAVASQQNVLFPQDDLLVEPFDVAYSLFSTILAATDPGAVFRNMQRLLKPGGIAVISLYSEKSCADRVDWYRRIGEGELIEKSKYQLEFDSGFISGFVTPETAVELFGNNVTIEPCLDFGYFISVQAV